MGTLEKIFCGDHKISACWATRTGFPRRVDQSFVDQMQAGLTQRSIVAAIVTLGHQMRPET
ncbi:hypothetical protein IQ273_29365 [Nodosilinea sp. LEGE 07298]|uniref:hypothetical protein n=1 Tax=Nodosilinea sp. LEGE 07298 TaxID=2777970 RepID=UPI0019FA9C1F|nr:hypothetical protein [Nodosilinea sp. LEGE 07298]MBE9113491.1 hypothetical protein [Nodosilinea sp. LEGE 07298]